MQQQQHARLSFASAIRCHECPATHTPSVTNFMLGLHEAATLFGWAVVWGTDPNRVVYIACPSCRES